MVLQIFDDIIATVDTRNVEGEMTIGAVQSPRTEAKIGEPEFSTLDEPIKDTIVIEKNLFYLHHQIVAYIIFCICSLDARTIENKFYHVLYPKEKTSLIKECEWNK